MLVTKLDIGVGWSTADHAWLSENVLLCSCKPVAPTRSHSCGIAFCGLLNPIASPLLVCWLSAPLYILSHLLCAVMECVLLHFQLPPSALTNPLSQVSMQTSSQKAKTSLPLLLMSPSKSLISGGVCCIFFASHLYFSKEWLLLPPCYWVNSS